MTDQPVLYLMCGKIASGKSTFAANLTREKDALLISEDDWLATLYSEEISSISDYVKYSARLRTTLVGHVVSLLKAGNSVVLDFPANNLEFRRWSRDLLDQSDAIHELHYLDVSNEICLARLKDRNKRGTHKFTPTSDQFSIITNHFVPPTTEEKFNVIHHRNSN